MACGEFSLIARYFDRVRSSRLDVETGIGDDCALLNIPEKQTLAISTDTLVAGNHFLTDIDPADLAWKALAVHIHSRFRDDVRGVLQQFSARNQRRHRRMLFKIFQHLWNRLFRLFQMMQTANQPQREGRFIGIEEAAAHQTVGRRTGKQTGCAFISL